MTVKEDFCVHFLSIFYLSTLSSSHRASSLYLVLRLGHKEVFLACGRHLTFTHVVPWTILRAALTISHMQGSKLYQNGAWHTKPQVLSQSFRWSCVEGGMIAQVGSPEPIFPHKQENVAYGVLYCTAPQLQQLLLRPRQKNKTCELLNGSDRGDSVQKLLLHWVSWSLPVLSSLSTTELPHSTIPMACIPFDPRSLEVSFIIWQLHLSAREACPHHWPASKEAWAHVHSHIF